MIVPFLDTSALVKRFIAEPGSAWVREITDAGSGKRPYTCALAGPELIATLVRGARSQRPLARRLDHLLADVKTQWTNLLRVVDVDTLVVQEAMRLSAD